MRDDGVVGGRVEGGEGGVEALDVGRARQPLVGVAHLVVVVHLADLAGGVQSKESRMWILIASSRRTTLHYTMALLLLATTTTLQHIE